MRFIQSIPVFLSAALLLLVLGEVTRMRGICSHWTLVAFIAAQFSATVLSWLMSQRVSTTSHAYAMVYGYTFAVVLGLGVDLCFNWSIGNKAWLGAIAGFSLAAIASAYLILNLPLPITEELSAQYDRSIMVAIIAGVFVAIGVWALFCAVEAKTPVDTTIALLLAAFWILEGGFLYANVAAKLNVNLAWVRQQYVLAPVIAILIFGLMAWNLDKAQRETAQQAIHADIAQVQEAR